MTTHELETGQTVIVAVVPRTATDLRINEEFSNPLYSVLYCNNTEEIYDVIEFAKHEISIVGTIQHPGVCSFDPKILGYKRKRWDRDDPYWQPEKSEQELMLADVKSWEYYWDNPMGELSNICPCDNKECRTERHKWFTAESRKLSVDQMVVLILKKP